MRLVRGFAFLRAERAQAEELLKFASRQGLRGLQWVCGTSYTLLKSC
jgi:hypothetical protein